MAKRRYNYILDDQLNPLCSIPPNHTVEVPTNWIIDPDLTPRDKCVLITMLCYANPHLDVQISRMQIRRVLGMHMKAIRTTTKRLTQFKYIRKLPTANGFIPVFRINIDPKADSKIKRKNKTTKI